MKKNKIKIGEFTLPESSIEKELGMISLSSLLFISSFLVLGLAVTLLLILIPLVFIVGLRLGTMDKRGGYLLNPPCKTPENKPLENKEPENKEPENKSPENKSPEKENKAQSSSTMPTLLRKGEHEPTYRNGVADISLNGMAEVMDEALLGKGLDFKTTFVSQTCSRVIFYIKTGLGASTTKLRNIDMLESIALRLNLNKDDRPYVEQVMYQDDNHFLIGFSKLREDIQTFKLKELLAQVSDEERRSFDCPVSLGRRVDGSPYTVDFRKLYHCYSASSSGYGKTSVAFSVVTQMLDNDAELWLIDLKRDDWGEVKHLIPNDRYGDTWLSGLRVLRRLVEVVESRRGATAEEKENFTDILLICEEYDKLKTNKLVSEDLKLVGEGFRVSQEVNAEIDALINQLAKEARSLKVQIYAIGQGTTPSEIGVTALSQFKTRIGLSSSTANHSNIITGGTGGVLRALRSAGDAIIMSFGGEVRVNTPFATQDDVVEAINRQIKRGLL